MTDYFTINTYDKEHLLMCEKEDLVEYIECLRVDVKLQHQENEEVWEQCGKVTSKKLKLHTENEKLKEKNDELSKEIHNYKKGYYRVKKHHKAFYERYNTEYEKNRKLRDEIKKLKEEIDRLKEENGAPCEIVDYEDDDIDYYIDAGRIAVLKDGREVMSKD